MPKRIVDGPGIWESHKLRQVHPPELRAEFANLIPLATANGVFECCEYQIYSKVYSFNRDGWSPEKVRTMLDEFERVKLLFRWVDAAGKKYGFWVGIDKKGRLPSRKRQDEKHEATGPEVPADLLDKFLSNSAVPHRDTTATNREPYREPNGQSWLRGTGTGIGCGSGTGEGESTGLANQRIPISYPMAIEDQTPPSLSRHTENGQDEPDDRVAFITQTAKQANSDASFSTKSLTALRAVCNASDFTLPEIKGAVISRIVQMDEFQLKNAGSLVAANLESDIAELRRREKRARETQELLANCTANEQEKARLELAEIERRRAEEDLLVEETLV